LRKLYQPNMKVVGETKAARTSITSKKMEKLLHKITRAKEKVPKEIILLVSIATSWVIHRLSV